MDSVSWYPIGDLNAEFSKWVLYGFILFISL